MVSNTTSLPTFPLTFAGVRSHEAKAIMKSKMKLGDKAS
jgi:predicted RNA-binding protein with PUA-like domain